MKIKKIGYIMSRFPHLPETFILREMTELEKLEIEIFLFPLIKQKPGIVHGEAQPWIEKAIFTPYISLKILRSNLKAIFSIPLKYLSAFFLTFLHNLSSLNLMARAILLFPKSVHIAMRAQELGIEHFHAHYATHPALVVWIIKHLTGINYSVTVHAHDIFVRKTMLAEKLGQAKFIIAISEFNKNYLSKEISRSLSNKIHVVHCGIRPEVYSPKGKERSKSSTYQVISIGSLQEYKGQIYLIEACSQLKKQDFQFHCHIIGEGEGRLGLEAVIREFGLSSHVTLHGGLPQEEVANYLIYGDCYVQPSIIARNKKMEGIPVAIMEAMAARLPVVATNISGIPEIVRHNQTGLLVSEKDPEELAEAISYLYKNSSEADAMALRASQLVRSEYNLVKNTQKIYDVLLSK